MQANYAKLISSVVPCRQCAAKVGELCLGQYRRRISSTHGTRTADAQAWRNASPWNRREWDCLKFETVWPPRIMDLINEGY